MSRLTQEQIREAWSQAFDTLEPVQSAMLTFAHRIAALAVQEVERERDFTINALMDENKVIRERNATLTAQLAEARQKALSNEEAAKMLVGSWRGIAEKAEAQLAEVTKERASAVGFYRIQAEEAFAEVNRLRAQLATAKREALTYLADNVRDGTRHPSAKSTTHSWNFAGINCACASEIEAFRDREYPAIDPDSGSTCKPDCTRVGYCAPGEGCHAKVDVQVSTRPLYSTTASGTHSATPSGEGVKDHGPMCPLDLCESVCDCPKRPATPSPEAREVVEPIDLPLQTVSRQVLHEDGYRNVSELVARITPADAKRIVRLAQEAE